MIVTEENTTAKRIGADLSIWGFTCLIAGIKEKVIERIVREAPELVILEMKGQISQAFLHELKTGSKIRRNIPVIALVTPEIFSRSNDYLTVDDFIIQPYDNRELVARARRILQKNTHEDEIIRAGDMEIDLARCEVRVQGKIVELTFKEYELLKFLINDRGRVFTREALLNKVWGYDYFGGDRTVDVHVRRLRSKIETSGQTFIETVRNIGYRFVKK
jgi:two-component system, OmpR family, alkaline phosphatase synthesis response regulator PhoP